MKILQVGKFPREHCGGIENAVFSLSEGLARENEVEVVTSGAGLLPRVERSGRLTCRRLPAWLTLFSTPVTPALVAHLRRASGFDIIQISFQNPMAAAAYWLARPKGKLVVWYHHDIVRQSVLGPLVSPFLRRVLERAAAVVATSPAYLKTSATLRDFEDKAVVIPLGVDCAPLNEKREVAESLRLRGEHGPLVLFIGRLVYYKGLSGLIEAMKGLRAKLMIIGQGPLEAQLRSQARKSGVADNVIFRNVPREESLGRYIHACDLLALPSTERTEAYGLALLEAMACGKPVVTTELGTGTSFVCEHGVTGLVVPPRDAAALREAISALLSDAGLARRMGEEGRKRAETRFSTEVMTRSFLDLYRRLLNGGRPC